MKKRILIMLSILICLVCATSCTDDKPHEHVYIDGKCNCGVLDPNYVIPHAHIFVDGICVCGEEDYNSSLYKEISIDEELLTKTIEDYDTFGRPSNFQKIIQDGWEINQSVPILEFSEIDKKYIGVYVDKTFMDLIRKEAEDTDNGRSHLEQVAKKYYDKNLLNQEIMDLYYNIVNKNLANEYFTLDGKIINRENICVKYYELNKQQEIPTIIDNYEIIGLYGNRIVTIIDDLYVKDEIGKEIKTYFWIPGIIENDKVIAKESLTTDIKGENNNITNGYNYYIRVKSSNNKYIYTGDIPLEDALLNRRVMINHVSIIIENDEFEYIVLPEFGVDNKNSDPNSKTINEKLAALLNKDLSRLATSELYLAQLTNYEGAEYDTYIDEYIQKYGYVYEVYEYDEILELINEYCR